jgi:hypothetical protein
LSTVGILSTYLYLIFPLLNQEITGVWQCHHLSKPESWFALIPLFGTAVMFGLTLWIFAGIMLAMILDRQTPSAAP